MLSFSQGCPGAKRAGPVEGEFPITTKAPSWAQVPQGSNGGVGFLLNVSPATIEFEAGDCGRLLSKSHFVGCQGQAGWRWGEYRVMGTQRGPLGASWERAGGSGAGRPQASAAHPSVFHVLGLPARFCLKGRPRA